MANYYFFNLKWKGDEEMTWHDDVRKWWSDGVMKLVRGVLVSKQTTKKTKQTKKQTNEKQLFKPDKIFTQQNKTTNKTKTKINKKPRNRLSSKHNTVQAQVLSSITCYVC
jgi:hypothetical protein